MAQLSEEVEIAEDNGDLTVPSDLLDFEPSEFDCPASFSEVVSESKSDSL